MDKVGLPKGLVRYSSLKAVEEGTSKIFTRRIKAYLVIWSVLMAAVITLFALRSDLDVVVLRQEGTTWVKMPEGVGNFYRLQIINKTSKELPYTLRVVSPSGAILKPLGLDSSVEAQQILKGRFMLILPENAVLRQDTKVVVNIESNGQVVKTVTTSFVGP
jgi:polyferredoxin